MEWTPPFPRRHDAPGSKRTRCALRRKGEASMDNVSIIGIDISKSSFQVRKIMSCDQAAPLQGWDLPDAFKTLQRLLEARQGKTGKREYVQVHADPLSIPAHIPRSFQKPSTTALVLNRVFGGVNRAGRENLQKRPFLTAKWSPTVVSRSLRLFFNQLAVQPSCSASTPSTWRSPYRPWRPPPRSLPRFHQTQGA